MVRNKEKNQLVLLELDSRIRILCKSIATKLLGVNRSELSRTRLAELNLVYLVFCNLSAVLELIRISRGSIFYKHSIGLLIRACLTDVLTSIYLCEMTEAEAGEELDVYNKDYAKALAKQFIVYQERLAGNGYSKEFLVKMFNLSLEDNFYGEIVYDENLEWIGVKNEELRVSHPEIKGAVGVDKMVARLQCIESISAVVERVYSYYKYFSQYEHFSERSYGDSIVDFGEDNISFPASIESLTEAVNIVLNYSPEKEL